MQTVSIMGTEGHMIGMVCHETRRRTYTMNVSTPVFSTDKNSVSSSQEFPWLQLLLIYLKTQM